MLSDRVQLNCPFVKYTCLESGVSWVLITHTAAIFSLKNKSCPGLPCPFLVVFSQKKISLTANWRSSAVSPDWSLVLSLTSFLLKSAALISVSPHVTDSSTASWMKMYWSREEKQHQVRPPCFPKCGVCFESLQSTEKFRWA